MRILTATSLGRGVWRWRLLVVSLTAAGALFANCGDNPVAPAIPSVAPYITGRVTAVTPVSDRSVSVRVEFNPADTTSCVGKAVAVVDDFSYVRLPGNREGDFESIELGQWIRLWHDGTVRESCPPQVRANAVAVDSLAH